MSNIGMENFGKSKIFYVNMYIAWLFLIVSYLNYGFCSSSNNMVVKAVDESSYVKCEFNVPTDFNLSNYVEVKNFLSYDGHQNKNALLQQQAKCETKLSDVCNASCEQQYCTTNNGTTTCGSEYSSCKSRCYSENHICVKYKNEPNKYFRIDASKINGGSNEHFYVFTKNVKAFGYNELPSSTDNCIFQKYSCDFNPGYEFGKYNNVIINGVNDTQFNEIINANIGEQFSLFKKVGECSNYTSCQDADKDIMEVKHYFKKIDINSKKVEYYIKNITSASCNNYLPSCQEIKEIKKPGTDGKIKSRFPLFSNNSKISGEQKANLEVLNGISGSVNCLDYDENNAKKQELSYCSDLKSTYDGSSVNKTVKYENGLEYDKNNQPVCLLKSCVDLTKEEVEVNENYNNNNKKNRKYCSEFIWLRNSSKLKFFPKSKPIYCSDVENGKLKFPEGINKTRDNCYLRRCVSLTTDQRRKVAEKNMENISEKINKYPNGSVPKDIDAVREGLPKYCENRIFLVHDDIVDTNKGFFEKFVFNDLKLNILPCADFSFKVNNVIDFKDIFFGTSENKYDINNNNKLCRSAILPVYDSKKIDSAGISYLCSVFITKNEDPTNTSDLVTDCYENNKLCTKNQKLMNICAKGKEAYGKAVQIDEITDYNEYTNIVKGVDNAVAFLNGDITDVRNGNFTQKKCVKYCLKGNYNQTSGKCNSVINDFAETCIKDGQIDESKCACETKTTNVSYLSTLMNENLVELYSNQNKNGTENKINDSLDNDKLTAASQAYDNCTKSDDECIADYDKVKKEHEFHIYDYFVNYKDYRPNANQNDRLGISEKSYFDCYLYQPDGLIDDKNFRNAIWGHCEGYYKGEEDNRSEVVPVDQHRKDLKNIHQDQKIRKIQIPIFGRL